MNVYLFRHGQKNSIPFADPDLTAQGFAQAKKLAEVIAAGELLRGTAFLASPRIRAQNTVKAAAALCGVDVHVASDLDQRENYETGETFRARIQQFLLSIEKKFAASDVVYLCSHHDWIEESLSVIPSDTDLLDSKYWSWNTVQFMHFEITDGIWKLQKFHRINI
ncbi:MAG: histidine phosphatase family protein [Bdellovibrionaceae bacterium]|nr:histidine phosphatase family protein [Pseudobdellovibrionaceae bacterium]